MLRSLAILKAASLKAIRGLSTDGEGGVGGFGGKYAKAASSSEIAIANSVTTYVRISDTTVSFGVEFLAATESGRTDGSLLLSRPNTVDVG